jgi:hypothetical protein
MTLHEMLRLINVEWDKMVKSWLEKFSEDATVGWLEASYHLKTSFEGMGTSIIYAVQESRCPDRASKRATHHYTPHALKFIFKDW